MGTIAEKLTKLIDTKERIRQAIIGQGQEVPAELPFSGYPDKITAIETGVDTSDATATAADVLSGKTFYAGGEKKTGSIITQELATPTISVASNGSITSSITQSTGYVETATKSKTYQLTTQGGKTVTPGTSQQTAVYSGRYTTGNVYVAGSSNLTAGNIRSGVNIFGVTGNYNPVLSRLVDGQSMTFEGSSRIAYSISGLQQYSILIAIFEGSRLRVNEIASNANVILNGYAVKTQTLDEGWISVVSGSGVAYSGFDRCSISLTSSQIRIVTSTSSDSAFSSALTTYRLTLYVA